jgi:TetR/AcrR family transcriptional repressor of mexJK operon
MAKTAAKIQRTGPGRLSAAQTEELPNRLMDAAFSLFAERGFADATMDDIARRAGASTKTLYSRFSNKTEILEAVVQRNIEQTVLAHLRSFALTPEKSSPQDYLFRFGMQIAIGVGDPGSALQRVSMAEAHRFPQLRKSFTGIIGRGVDAVANALRIWRDRGLVAFTEDSHVVATVVFSALSDVPRTRAVIGEPMSRVEAERHVAAAVSLVLNGMKPDAKVRRAGKLK